MVDWTCGLCEETHSAGQACWIHLDSGQVFCPSCEGLLQRFLRDGQWQWYTMSDIRVQLRRPEASLAAIVREIAAVHILDVRLRSHWAQVRKAYETHQQSPPGGPTFDVYIEALKALQALLTDTR